MSAAPKTNFWSLPRELRNKIYKHYLHDIWSDSCRFRHDRLQKNDHLPHYCWKLHSPQVCKNIVELSVFDKETIPTQMSNEAYEEFFRNYAPYETLKSLRLVFWNQYNMYPSSLDIRQWITQITLGVDVKRQIALPNEPLLVLSNVEYYSRGLLEQSIIAKQLVQCKQLRSFIIYIWNYEPLSDRKECLLTCAIRRIERLCQVMRPRLRENLVVRIFAHRKKSVPIPPHRDHRRPSRFSRCPISMPYELADISSLWEPLLPAISPKPRCKGTLLENMRDGDLEGLCAQMYFQKVVAKAWRERLVRKAMGRVRRLKIESRRCHDEQHSSAGSWWMYERRTVCVGFFESHYCNHGFP